MRIPKSFPVKPLRRGTRAYREAKDLATCGTCGRSWDDAIVTSWTPSPAARCPFENFHTGRKDLKTAAYVAAARRLFHRDGEIEIDDNARVSRGSDPGAYVQAWVWVANDQVTRKDGRP